jgi:GPH family glycoside/pentoside/hexuronide:cation symporter
MEDKEVAQVSQAPVADKIRFSQLAAYGAGGIIPIALFNIAGILVGLMGNISLGLSAFWLGVILIIPRLWDALSDPVIGHVSDNTRTRWGRRRPFLLIGGLLVAAMFVLMWWIPKGELVHSWFPTDTGYQWFQLIYILITLLLFFTAVNIFEIPHGALGMEMTNDYHERTRLFSAKSFVGNLFAMSTPWLFALANLEVFKGPGGNEADGMRYVSIMIAAILIPLTFWWTYKLREPGFVKASKQQKTPFWQDMKRTASNRNFVLLTLTIFTLAMGFNFVQLLGSYIPIFYVFGGDKVAGARLLGINGTIWAVTGLLAVFPLNWISPRAGKRNTLIIAILLMVAAQLSKIVCYNPDLPYLIIIPTILLSAGMLFFFTLGSSMVGDICDEDELKTGYRSEGSFYAIFWWFIKMGTALASFVAGALIVLTMFDQNQVTKVDSLRGAVKEMRAGITEYKDMPSAGIMSATWTDKLRGDVAEARKESADYLKLIEKDMARDISEVNPNVPGYAMARKAELEKAAEIARDVSVRLAVAENDSATRAAWPSLWEVRLAKAGIHAFELENHLLDKAASSKRSQDHYNEIITSIRLTREKLAQVDLTRTPAELDVQLGSIEEGLSPLTRQTPYTLLMMRIVEIGLPALLSLLSLLFILSYSLTEKRSLEIKELLKKRT